MIRIETRAFVFHTNPIAGTFCNHRIRRVTKTRVIIDSWCRDGASGPDEWFPRGELESTGVRRNGLLYVYKPALHEVITDNGKRIGEYLFTSYLPDQGDWRWLPRRVVRTSEKFVWVEYSGRTVRLARADLDRDGFAWSNAASESFYVDPSTSPLEQITAPARIAEHLVVLGLRWPCTADDVRDAWRRLARETHPDAGGTTERFIAARAAYDAAIAMVNQ